MAPNQAAWRKTFLKNWFAVEVRKFVALRLSCLNTRFLFAGNPSVSDIDVYTSRMS